MPSRPPAAAACSFITLLASTSDHRLNIRHRKRHIKIVSPLPRNFILWQQSHARDDFVSTVNSTGSGVVSLETILYPSVAHSMSMLADHPTIQTSQPLDVAAKTARTAEEEERFCVLLDAIRSFCGDGEVVAPSLPGGPDGVRQGEKLAVEEEKARAERRSFPAQKKRRLRFSLVPRSDGELRDAASALDRVTFAAAAGEDDVGNARLSSSSSKEEELMTVSVAESALRASRALRAIGNGGAEGGGREASSSGDRWHSLRQASSALLSFKNVGGGDRSSDDGEEGVVKAIAVSAVSAALALDGCDVRGPSRAAAAAVLASSMAGYSRGGSGRGEGDSHSQREKASNGLDGRRVERSVARGAVRAMLVLASGETDGGDGGGSEGVERRSGGTRCPLDLHIVASLARSYKIEADDDDESAEGLASAAAGAVRGALGRIATTTNDAGVAPASLGGAENSDHNNGKAKGEAAAALSLAEVLGPWSTMSPVPLVLTAVQFDLWHGADLVCASAVRHGRRRPDSNSTVVPTNADAKDAVRALIYSALDTGRNRQADAFATKFYDDGGEARYAECRLRHAKDTITKLVRKRHLSPIERQVERVDHAFARVGGGGAASSEGGGESGKIIRMHTLEALKDRNEHAAARRLAKLWSMEYEYREADAARDEAARRKRYIQWEDVLPGTAVPGVTSTPGGLVLAFSALLHSGTTDGDDKVEKGGMGSAVVGFDVEWDDRDINGGAALLQLATTRDALLIDIPSLSSTSEGSDALEQTVGRLFTEGVVVGFGCRQDLKRLRSSPCAQGRRHWLEGANAVVDVRSLIEGKVPALKKRGLATVCEHFLGKPLDKSEQCSVWTARPLSCEQRSYAALDAWACAAIHAKLFPSGISSLPSRSHLQT